MAEFDMEVERIVGEQAKADLKEALHAAQQHLLRKTEEINGMIQRVVQGTPAQLVEFCTYGFRHEVDWLVVNLKLDSLAEKAARFAVTEARLQAIEEAQA